MFIPVINVKGQYNHLITRALADLGVESGLVPMDITKDELESLHIAGFVMGGGPQRVGRDWRKLGNTPNLIKEMNVPMMGFCLTHQLIAIVFGGKAGPAKYPEYGPVEVFVDEKDEILEGFGKSFKAWEAHNDEIIELPKDFKVLAHSEKCKMQAIKHVSKPIFGTQFHPEVVHTENGSQIFKNFIRICKR